MAIPRARSQFGMELAAEKPRMTRQLHDLDQAIVWRGAGRLEARLLQRLAIGVVDLVAMAVTLGDAAAAIERQRERPRTDRAGVRSQAHRAALAIDCLLVLHDVDHRIGRRLIDFARVGLFEPDQVARDLDHHHLQAEADAEDRHAALARVTHRADLALDPTLAESARYDDRVGARQARRRISLFQLLGVEVVDID